MTAGIAFACAWLSLADGASSCGPGDARAHIANGHGRSDQNDELGALAEFRCAYRVDGSMEALAQIGLAEMALGRWVDAETDLEKALAQARDPWIRARRAPLEAALEKIRDNLGELIVDGSPVGAEILIDGRKAARLPLARPLRMPAGRVEIYMRADGYQPVSRDRRIEARVLARETIELVPVEPPSRGAITKVAGPGPSPWAAPLPPAPAAPPGTAAAPAQVAAQSQSVGARPSRWPGWVTLGGAVAALGVGITFHVLREERARDFNTNALCGDEKPAYGGGDCTGLHSDVAVFEKVLIGGYAAAALLGVASAYFFLSATDAGAAPTHAFACGVAPEHGAGLACAGRF